MAETSVNTLENRDRATIGRTLAVIGTFFLIITTFVQFVTVDMPYILEVPLIDGSHTLFGFLNVSALTIDSGWGILLIVAYIVFTGLFIVSDIAWKWSGSRVLSIISFCGSVVLLAVYVVLLAVANNNTFGGALTFSFGFYLWAIAVILKFVSIVIDDRQ